MKRNLHRCEGKWGNDEDQANLLRDLMTIVKKSPLIDYLYVHG